MSLPNQLTILRLVLLPIFVMCFYAGFQWHYYLCGMLFLLAGVTDWLDGYLARKFNLETRFGAFLDPVADKLIVAAALILMCSVHISALYVIPAVVMICREITISALREWMAGFNKRSAVKVGAVGKWKTTFQFIGIVGLLFALDEPLLLDKLHSLCWPIGLAGIWLAMGLSLWSMGLYFRQAKDAI